MTTSQGTLGDNVGSPKFGGGGGGGGGGGVVNPESSTHLLVLLIFPKLTSKMAAEAEF